ncbi:MAG: restriction endonuclease subunit S [Prevotella sp.]|nr:restriction endonuclease subunit S [Prevotella sp.]
MSEWQKVNLGDCCEITSSKRIFFSEYVESGIPFYRSKEIIEKGKGEEISHPLYISKEKYDEIKGKYGVPQKGDLLLTAVGSLGIPFVVKDDTPFYFKDGNLVWLKHFQDIDPIFLYYWIKSENGYNALYNIAIGSAQKALTIAAIKGYEIPLPPLQTQHRIATILSRYDSLIENYQKQIKLLEEAAQRLYKEWFVDLHFPGHENTKIVDGVPEGWEKKRLSDIANIIMGQSPKSEFYNTEGDGIPFHQGVGSYGYRFVVDNVYSTSFTRIAEPNSILFSVRAPVGRLNITKNKIVIGRGLASINHKMGYQSYLYYLLKEKFFKDNIIGNGAIFASISKDELYNLVFFIPSDEIVKRYDAIANKIDKNIQYVDSQIRLLTEARDRLLPKLMSGEIAV